MAWRRGSEPFILGVKVYAECSSGTSTADSSSRDDELLGEASISSSLLKKLPFHYLPIRLSSPTQTSAGVRHLHGRAGSAARAPRDPALLGLGLDIIFSDVPTLSALPESGGIIPVLHTLRADATHRDVPGEAARCQGASRASDDMKLLLKVHEAENLVSIYSTW